MTHEEKIGIIIDKLNNKDFLSFSDMLYDKFLEKSFEKLDIKLIIDNIESNNIFHKNSKYDYLLKTIDYLKDGLTGTENQLYNVLYFVYKNNKIINTSLINVILNAMYLCNYPNIIDNDNKLKEKYFNKFIKYLENTEYNENIINEIKTGNFFKSLSNLHKPILIDILLNKYNFIEHISGSEYYNEFLNIILVNKLDDKTYDTFRGLKTHKLSNILIERYFYSGQYKEDVIEYLKHFNNKKESIKLFKYM